MQRKQSGFTLLEVAIVMMIISLMIVLTFKAQELVNNSRVKSLAGDFRSLQIAIYGYQDRYRALPGDGNAIIGGNWNAASGESFNLWQHSASSGADSYIPLYLSGDTPAVAETAAAPISAMRENYIICSDRIAGKFVKQLDLMLDDGNTSGGALLASNASTGGERIATNDIVEDSLYLTCLGV
jgi:prepilin-type N-terminal cleavage/methylation domain-containing protein